MIRVDPAVDPEAARERAARIEKVGFKRFAKWAAVPRGSSDIRIRSEASRCPTTLRATRCAFNVIEYGLGRAIPRSPLALSADLIALANSRRCGSYSFPNLASLHSAQIEGN